MKLLFLTPYYPPEIGAPQTRIHELAVRLVRRGHRVQVVTALPNYPSGIVPPEYRDRAGTWEERDGVEIYRTWIFATPNRGFLLRILNHLSFMAMAILAAPNMGACDIVYVESPPLFDGIAGFVLSRLKHARVFFNVADIWPLFAVELGMLENPGLIRIAQTLERFCYATAERVLAVTLGIEQELKDRGLENVVYFPNGVDVGRFETGDGREFRATHGMAGEFVVIYAGTIGMGQALETAIAAARILEGDPLRVRFVFIGDGAEKEALMREAGPNVTFLDPVPKEEMPNVLAAADAILVSCKDLPVARYSVPSKTYEAMAAARPVVLCARGEAPALLTRAGAGLVVPPEDPRALAEVVRTLGQDPGRGREMGARGREFVRRDFDRDRLADRFEALAAQSLGLPAPTAGPL